MPKSLVLSNGNMLVGLDRNGLVHDLYFPYVGLDNHIGSHYVHKIGVWIDQTFSWLDDGSWEITIESASQTLAGQITAINHKLKIKIMFYDVVYNEKSIFLRKVEIFNEDENERTVKIFFNQQFEIYNSHLKDTAFYDPIHECIIHYKGRRVFLINAITSDHKGFDDYCVGILGLEGKEGTYKDAEDGQLTKNAIEHGSVDSIIGLSIQIPKKSSKRIMYWIAAATSIKDVYDLNNYVLSKSPDHLIQTTTDFWKAWVLKESFNLDPLDKTVSDLFTKSLLIMRTHVDHEGAIIASCDSDMLQQGRDNYSYMWPRDGAFVAIALDKAGDNTASKRFFEFSNTLLTNDGYFLHKYRPDRSLGSSWHPWVRNGEIALPIQEDETALVIYALWKHYESTRDLEFIEDIYNSLIKKAGHFMVSYRDKKTGLPLPSYDLWEEKWGISTFTSSSVFAGLSAASKFAKLLGKRKEEELYGTVAGEIKTAILQHLYNKADGSFYKHILFENGNVIHDTTIDMSSIYGIYKFGLLKLDDPLVEKAMKVSEKKLKSPGGDLGIARFDGDWYYNTVNYHPGNPWIITTLWLAQYYIAKANNKDELQKALPILEWVTTTASSSGNLPEQVNPYTKEPFSASPLTWSHGEFVVTVIEYLEKLEQLKISPSRKTTQD